MENKSLTVTIELAKPAQEVFSCLTSQAANWWGGKDLSGGNARLHDEFVIHHPGAHYSKQKVVEFVAGQKWVWLVTDSKLDWLQNNKSEWTNTKMIFELEAQGEHCLLHFTHQGLVPELECYPLVEKGWNTVIRDYLFNYVTEGKIAEALYR